MERVIQSGIKPDVPVPKPSQPAPAPSPKMDVPAPSHDPVVSFPPSPMQNKALNKIVSDLDRRVESGEITANQAGEIKARIEAIHTSDEARAFLEGYQK